MHSNLYCNMSEAVLFPLSGLQNEHPMGFFFRQIDKDCEFLEAERIMDYSLLVGLHFRDDLSVDKMGMPLFSCKSISSLLVFALPMTD